MTVFAAKRLFDIAPKLLNIPHVVVVVASILTVPTSMPILLRKSPCLLFTLSSLLDILLQWHTLLHPGTPWTPAPLLTRAYTTQIQAKPLTYTFDAVDLFNPQMQPAYSCYKIPYLAQALNGTLLAFAEARGPTDDPSTLGNCMDWDIMDVVLRKSYDGGHTWSAMETLLRGKYEEHWVVGNLAPVQDGVTGRLLLPFVRGNSRMWLTYSDDNGESWAEPARLAFEGFWWTWVGFGPPAGLQMVWSEKHYGRILLPGYFSDSPIFDLTGIIFSKAFLLYSDDHGHTWSMVVLSNNHQELLGIAGNEDQVAELHDGSLVLSLRTWLGERLQASSYDGGATWSSVARVPLPNPLQGCQGSLFTLNDKVLLYSGVEDFSVWDGSRFNLTLWESLDGGRNWRENQKLHIGSSSYSALWKLLDGNMGVVYETSKEISQIFVPENIYFRAIRLEGGGTTRSGVAYPGERDVKIGLGGNSTTAANTTAGGGMATSTAEYQLSPRRFYYLSSSRTEEKSVDRAATAYLLSRHNISINLATASSLYKVDLYSVPPTVVESTSDNDTALTEYLNRAPHRSAFPRPQLLFRSPSGQQGSSFEPYLPASDWVPSWLPLQARDEVWRRRPADGAEVEVSEFQLGFVWWLCMLHCILALMVGCTMVCLGGTILPCCSCCCGMECCWRRPRRACAWVARQVMRQKGVGEAARGSAGQRTDGGSDVDAAGQVETEERAWGAGTESVELLESCCSSSTSKPRNEIPSQSDERPATATPATNVEEQPVDISWRRLKIVWRWLVVNSVIFVHTVWFLFWGAGCFLALFFYHDDPVRWKFQLCCSTVGVYGSLLLTIFRLKVLHQHFDLRAYIPQGDDPQPAGGQPVIQSIFIKKRNDAILVAGVILVVSIVLVIVSSGW